MEPRTTSSTDAAIYAAIIAIRAAIAALETSHAATMALLVLESKETSNLNARIGALPMCVKHHLLKFVIPKPSLGPFSMIGGSWTFIYPDWTVDPGIVRLELTDRIPDPGQGAYILKFICKELHGFATGEFPPFDSCYQFKRVDHSDHWSIPRVPTVRAPICFEWTTLEAGQDGDGWWAKIGCRLSLYNEDGRWTAQRLESITSLVNKGLEEAIRREEEQPYYMVEQDDMFDMFAFDDFGDIGDGDE